MSTEALARTLATLRYDDLSVETRVHARQFFLDWLACCLRGAGEPAPGILAHAVADEASGTATATVFGAHPRRAPAGIAALLNGAASHTLDMDDLHNASIIHLGTVVMPAALAVAERTHASGRRVIEAIVAGCEAGARIGEAVNPESYFYWHTTGTAGTLAAAAAAAKVLGLDTAQTVACLGSAGTQAAGLWEFIADGAMSKALHAGRAAQSGILSADLAAEGFTAAKRILEGDKGFCRAMSPTPHFDKLSEGLGQSWRLDGNGYKAYTCCRHCHPAIAAALVLRDRAAIDPARIAAIHVKTYRAAAELVDNAAPATPYGYKFSLQYCVAAALLDGRVGLDAFTPEAVARDAARRLMSVLDVAIDPDIDAAFRRDPMKWAAEVAIETSDGASFREYVPYPKGDPMNPLSYAETEAKFRDVAAPRLPGGTADRLLRFAAGLDAVPDVAEALAFLSVPAVAA